MKATYLLAMLFVAGTATAQQHGTVTGSGGPIPASGTGDGTYPGALPSAPAASDVNVPDAVTSVTSIEVTGLSHTWIGDLQMVLCDPNGVGHLIFLRPGYLNPSGAGNSGDFLGGDYVFVESGGLDLPTTSNTAVNPPPGTYNQTFDSGGVTWVDGDQNIFNTPMSQITGPAGTWTLKFYDWAGGDTGAFTGWTLNYRSDGGTGTAICFGDGSGAPCGCGNETGGGGGCRNSLGIGAVLSADGDADTTADTMTLTAEGVRAQPGLFFQGNNTIGGGSGQTFGDGVRCCGQTVVRIEIVTPAGPEPATATMSETATTNGNPGTIQPGDKKCYQYWYRDPGGSPCGSNFNLSNAVTATWS